MGRPYVKEERLRQRIERYGWPRSFLFLQDGNGYAFEGSEKDDTGQNDDGSIIGKKVEVELSDIRKPGIVTLEAMKQYERIEKFLSFLKSWYLCYFSPAAVRRMQSAAPQAYLNKDGSNINNVAQYMYRENRKDFEKVLKEIQTKLPGIEKIEPVKFDNGQMMLRFWKKGFKEPFYSPRMSDGTLKLFAYYLLLNEKNVGKGFSKQLFITTHSPFFVNALLPEDVWVLTKGPDSFTTAKRASEYPFVQELSDEGVVLGDMWYIIK